MERNFTTTQLLRLNVEKYGKLLGIENYYDRVKKYEWRIKNAKDRSEKWQLKQLEKYRTGIEFIENGYCSKYDALKDTYLKHTRLTKKRSKTRKK